MGVFKKSGKFYIDYYVEGRRKREMIGPDRKLAETVLAKRKVEIAENHFLDKRQAPSVTFQAIAKDYLTWSKANKRSFGLAATLRHFGSGLEFFSRQDRRSCAPPLVYVSRLS